MSAGVPSCGPARAGAAAGDGLRVGRWPRGLDAPRKQGGTPATFFRAPVSGEGSPSTLGRHSHERDPRCPSPGRLTASHFYFPSNEQMPSPHCQASQEGSDAWW